MKSIIKLLSLININEKRRGLLTLFAIFIMALLDTIGAASIMPFIAVLSDQTLIYSNPFLNFLYTYLDFQNVDNFFIFFGLCVFLILTVSLSFKSWVTYLQLRFSFLVEHRLAKNLLGHFLNQPYLWFLGQNTSNLGKIILSEVQQLVHNAVIPGMYGIANFAVSFCLLTLLFVVEPLLTLITIIVLGLAYVCLYGFSKKFLEVMGDQRTESNDLRFKTVSEALNAIAEVKVGVFEECYEQKFHSSSLRYAIAQANCQIISQIPRYGLEIITFGGMVITLLFLIGKNNSIIEILPTLALFAIAGYKMIPALQHVYSAVSHLKYAQPIIEKISYDLEKLSKSRENLACNDTIKFNNNFLLKNVSFSYQNSNKYTLKNINIEFKPNSLIGLVGASGAGKSTIAGILLGIIKPETGSLIVDGISINKKNIASWRRCVGYVPQQIYLSEKSIAENIAFNVPSTDIDFDRVTEVSKIAGLHSVVISSFSNGYKTIVGERGMRVSGGQRQRIAIARALYKRPNLIVFDEATSGLDVLTESEFINSLLKLKKETTIITITHRMTTLKDCDKIYYIKNGNVNAQGCFKELTKKCTDFKNMISN